MLILFSLFAAIGATITLIVLVAWYRGLLPILASYIETMGDILAGKDIIIHRISLDEFLDEYLEDEDDEDE